MKAIKLQQINGISTVDIIKTVTENPQTGALLPEIRSRNRVLRALEKNASTDELRLEDADHQTLVNALNAFRFGRASTDLETIADDIIGAASV